MNGINALFHVGSALALLLLVIMLLRLRQQRDFLRRLANERHMSTEMRRAYVETPAGFIRRFAESLGLAIDNGQASGRNEGFEAPARIDILPFFDLHLSYGIKLIRCGSTLEIVTREQPARAEAADRLSVALGNKVKVVISN